MNRKILLRLFALVACLLCSMSAAAAEAYACYTSSNTTLTFYYDNLRSTRSGTTYDMNVGSQSPDWYFDNSYSSVTKVVFNSSFADARPVSTCRWFVGMTNLQSITGMEYLNTSLVLNMSAMFQQCEVLGSVDVSHFNTARVTDMSHMFYSCKKLTSIDVSSFNTANVTNMYRMFGYCSQVTSLNLSSFNTANVTNMKEMFYACPVLTTIYVNSGWSTASVTNSTDMFKTCYNLVGGMGTAYNSSHVDKGYAHIDVGPSNPGYLSCNLPAEPYAEYTPDNTTLTFHYDNVRAYRAGTTYDLNTGYYMPGWTTNSSDVKYAAFDPSFSDACPKSTHSWFSSMQNLQSITGLEYLNTSEVTDMAYMFNDCIRLTSLDVSHFNTEKVTTMNSMFYGCLRLESLDVSAFNTAKVENMQWMFLACKALTSLDVSHFDTKNVQDMNHMFYNCNNLSNLDVSHFDTKNVQNMKNMFGVCSALTSLDLSNFNTANVTSMEGMFSYSPYLTTIFTGNGWSTAAINPSEIMFKNCINLVGGMGTTYDANHVDAAYAHIDGGTSNPGYFTEKPAEAYVCRTTSTVTFYYDTQRSTHDEGTTYSLGSLGWTSGNNQAIMHITIDPSFADARPTSTARWFYNFPQLKSISGLQYLNTSEVTDMTSMFSGCHIMGGCPDLSTFNTANVTSMASMFDNFWGNNDMLDLSSFNTANVTDMAYMFSNSYLVGNLDLSNFNTANVTNMNCMFNGCSSITALDVSSFNTSSVTSMYGMFRNCSGLTSLDLSNFNTANVTDMACMFYNDTSLTTITVGEGWNTDAVTSSSMMFNDCTKLVGGKGTTYDANHVDAAYAHIDGGPSNPGYFTGINATIEPEAYVCFSFSDDYNTTLTFYYDDQRSSREGPYDKTYDLPTGNDLPEWEAEDDINSWVNNVVFDPSFSAARPTTTRGWFEYMSFLRSITGMKEYLNTSEVTDMSYMFYHCYRLTSVDLSGFNTERVTTMERMFSGIGVTNLDLSSFNTAAVDTMIYMFSYCDSLTTLDLSSFNTTAVKRMTYMFGWSNRLKTIYVGDEWSTASVAYSPGIFQNCTSLVGGMGTTYDANHTGVEYAHIDGGPSNPGYFTAKSASLRGDVNGDGNVNITDVTMLISAIMSENYSNINTANADMNGDGIINITDVTSLINLIMSN